MSGLAGNASCWSAARVASYLVHIPWGLALRELSPSFGLQMPRTRVHGQENAEALQDKVRSQGGRRVKIRAMVGYEGEKEGWYLVTWDSPQPFNVYSHLWWVLALAIAYALWRINA